MKNLSLLFFAAVVFVGCQGMNEVTKKIVQEPYWQLTELVQDGNNVPLKFETGFTLYSGGGLSGSFPVNGFSGTMLIAENGEIKFGECMWTSMAAEDRSRMQEELLMQQILFKLKKAKVENNLLIMSDENNKLTFSPSDFGYMKNIQKNKWELVGMEEEEESEVVAYYADSSEQYKNLEETEEKITLSCSSEHSYDEASNSIVYTISGVVSDKDYSAKLYVSKSSGRMSLKNLSSNDNTSEYLKKLANLNNFSFMHNNMHLNAGLTLLVFRAAK